MNDPRRVSILAYHALDEYPSAISTSPATFEGQMRWLHEEGYSVLRVCDLVQLLRSGGPLPPRATAITFDDGFESVYTVGFPILARYGFPATVFLLPKYCGGANDWPSQPPAVPRAPLLTWSHITEMDAHGIDFGAHSMTHPRLDMLDLQAMEYEVLASKSSVEEPLGHTIDLFAYPYGRYSETVQATVRKAYSGACAGFGQVTLASDRFALERIDAYYVQHPRIFQSLASPTFPLYVMLRRHARSAASTILRRPWK